MISHDLDTDFDAIALWVGGESPNHRVKQAD
jgi:hypothetical protein